MHYSTSLLLAAAAAPLLVSAAPVRRAASANDALVFQFANVLEQLETNFYAQGLAKFKDSDFQAAGFTASQIPTQLLNTIGIDEATHTTVLQQALTDNGAKPLKCNFKFDSALVDVPTMAATARTVEYVGVAAYLGAATLIDDPVFLDAAASIVTVEARHQTVLNILSGKGSAIAQAFDIPLTPPEVLSIAGGFIDGPCDTGVKSTTPLTVTNTDPIQSGTKLTFKADGLDGTDGKFCNMMVGGAPFSINLPLDQCVVPPGINGAVALWITSDNNPLANNVIDRDTTKQVAGPAIIFVDSSPEMIGQMVRGGTNGQVTVTTQTISNDQASSIISAAGSQQTGSSSNNNNNNASNNNGTPAAPASTPLPSDFTGLSPDGKTTVLGIKMVPKPLVADASGSASASGASASASSAGASSSAAAPTSSSN